MQLAVQLYIRQSTLLLLVMFNSINIYHISTFIISSIESEENEFPPLPYAAQDTMLTAARCKFN
jgi:hypothetical protein